jgi:hypothetical protein
MSKTIFKIRKSDVEKVPNKAIEEKLVDKFILDLGPFNAFGTRNRDEWKTEGFGGVFKRFAAPVIPFIEKEKVKLLNQIWLEMKPLVVKEELRFEEALHRLKEIKPDQVIEAEAIFEDWLERCLFQPLYFQESLERARLQSFAHDKELTEIFFKEELPENIEERIGKLIGRLEAAFCAAAPFYNVEAIVDDFNGFKWNPVAVAEKKSRELITQIDKIMEKPVGAIIFEGMRINLGKRDLLDKYELLQLLPSLIDKYSKEIRNWQDVARVVKEIERNDKETFSLLWRLSIETNRPVEDILFAGYTLNFIQTKLKNREVISESETLWLLQSINKNHRNKKEEFFRLMPSVIKKVEWDLLNELEKYAQIIRIAEEMNSLIRFFNWLPLIRSQENFEGRLLTYAAVCDTTNLLIEELKNNQKIWRTPEDRMRFLAGLDELKKVDPTSSKGRWALSFLRSNNSLPQKVYEIAEEEKIIYLSKLR